MLRQQIKLNVDLIYLDIGIAMFEKEMLSIKTLSTSSNKSCKQGYNVIQVLTLLQTSSQKLIQVGLAKIFNENFLIMSI